RDSIFDVNQIEVQRPCDLAEMEPGGTRERPVMRRADHRLAEFMLVFVARQSVNKPVLQADPEAAAPTPFPPGRLLEEFFQAAGDGAALLNFELPSDSPLLIWIG